MRSSSRTATNEAEEFQSGVGEYAPQDEGLEQQDERSSREETWGSNQKGLAPLFNVCKPTENNLCSRPLSGALLTLSLTFGDSVPGIPDFLAADGCMDSLSSQGRMWCSRRDWSPCLATGSVIVKTRREAARAMATLRAHQRSNSQGKTSACWGTRRRGVVLQCLVWHYIIAVTLGPRSRTDGHDSGPGVDDRGAMVWSDCKVWVDPQCRQ